MIPRIQPCGEVERVHRFGTPDFLIIIQHFLVFMREIDRKMSEILDEETLKIFDELRHVTGIDSRNYQDLRVLPFLHLCLYPTGTGNPVKITKDCIDQVDNFDEFLLRKKVGSVGDSLARLLRGFVVERGESLEKYSGNAIYMFLNRMLVPTKRKRPRRDFQ